MKTEQGPVRVTREIRSALADLRDWYDAPGRRAVEAGQPLAGIIRRLVGNAYPGDFRGWVVDPERPWDHPYDGSPDDPNRCIHCGYTGSYAHTEDYYRRWVWPVLITQPEADR